MFRIFQNIRQKLLNQNKFGEYLKYASGEIILVVIGILIAIQIDGWNNDRINKKDEKIIFKQLNKEFRSNQEQLDKIIKEHRTNLDYCNRIIALTPIKLDSINLDTIVNYLNEADDRYTFNPIEGTINSLLTTGEIQIIRNKELRQLLIIWKDVVKDYQEEEMFAVDFMKNRWMPYFGENLPILHGTNDPRFDRSKLESLEFENIIVQRRKTLVNIITSDSELSKIHDIIDQIIQLTENP